MNIGLSRVRVAPFFGRLLVLVVALSLVIILLVLGPRINAPSFGELAPFRVEGLLQHFHGFSRIRFAEQATWYARGHGRAGQHREVNFATDRSCQHLENFLCFDDIETELNRSREIASTLEETTLDLLASCRERKKTRDAPFSSLPRAQVSSVTSLEGTPIDFLRLFCQNSLERRRSLSLTKARKLN